jgi:hypothetical protein
MTRMIPPKGMKELGVQTSRGTRVLKAGKDGLFHVNDPKLARKLKSEGLGEASVAGVITNPSQVGYTCKACGFGSFFRKCGKCGEINE